VNSPGLYFASYTAGEAREILRNKVFLIVPVGNIENHGPHLPLATDLLIAEELSTRLAAALSKRFRLYRPKTCSSASKQVRFVVSPPIAVGSATKFGEKTGLSCGLALAEYLWQICQSALKRGFAAVIIVNGCGGNDAQIRAVNKRSRKIIYLPRWWHIQATHKIDNSFRKFLAEGGSASDWVGTHAGELETSALLAIERKHCVQLVRKNRLAQAKGPCSRNEMNAVRSRPISRRLTTSGVLGDASRASAKKGEKLLKTIVNLYAQQIVSAIRKRKI
jgi:creatinine amidohydrolase